MRNNFILKSAVMIAMLIGAFLILRDSGVIPVDNRAYTEIETEIQELIDIPDELSTTQGFSDFFLMKEYWQ